MVDTRPFETICVVGAGYMGSQIGLLCAFRGFEVRLHDVSDDALNKAWQSITQELDSWVKDNQISTEEKKAIIGRIQASRGIEEAASDADLVIEAIPERLENKRDVFKKLDRVCESHTILATNSSSIRVSKIEDATRRPDRVLNMHFYTMPWRRSIVELMRGTETSDETVERVWLFASALGLTPLMVLKESTGFIFNRVWRAIKKETLHLVDDGVASFEDVDRAWMILHGASVGPFGMMDRIGLDVVRDIEMVYYQESGDDSDRPPRLLLDKIEKGELGVKTGRGFYTYPDPAYQDPSWLRASTIENKHS